MEVLKPLPTPRTGLSSFYKASFYIQLNVLRSKLFRKLIKIHYLTPGKSKGAVSCSCVDSLLIRSIYRAEWISSNLGNVTLSVLIGDIAARYFAF